MINKGHWLTTQLYDKTLNMDIYAELWAIPSEGIIIVTDTSLLYSL